MKHRIPNFCWESLSQDVHAILVNFFLFLHWKQNFPPEKVFLLICISDLFEVVAVSLKNIEFQQILGQCFRYPKVN